MLPLSRFEVLRVLDLEGCSNLEKSGHHNLSSFVDLLHLRYLGLRNTKLRMVPMEIGKLLFLQTLDLEGVHEDVEELPVSVVQLRSLMFLYVKYCTCLPVGYKNLTSLEVLKRPEFKQDGDPEELSYLTKLRVLEFSLPSMYPSEKILTLLESLDKLQKLQHLFIRFEDANTVNLGDRIPSLPQLRCLVVSGWYATMSTRISSSSLPLVSYLDIDVHHVRLEDIQVLGTLPALRTLKLQSDLDTATEEERAEERLFMLRADAFPLAIKCELENVLFAPYMFPRGAMPMVQELLFGLLVSDILSGADWELFIRNLPSLKKVWIKLYDEEDGSDDEEAGGDDGEDIRERHSEAIATVEGAIINHPNLTKLHAY